VVDFMEIEASLLSSLFEARLHSVASGHTIRIGSFVALCVRLDAF
jgi:hypothetical protein